MTVCMSCNYSCSCRSLANSLAISEKNAGAWDAPNGRATNRPIWPLPRRIPMYIRAAIARMAWWKPCRQSRFPNTAFMWINVIRASMDGRCNGKGVIDSLTPVIVGFVYGRTSVESFLVVQPSGLMVETKLGCGVNGSKSGKYCCCNSITPAWILL